MLCCVAVAVVVVVVVVSVGGILSGIEKDTRLPGIRCPSSTRYPPRFG